jgi:hypothetical protein
VIDETQRSRSTLAVALVGAVPFLVLAAWHWRYGALAQFGDWAQYMSHADAILHGRRYGDIGYIFTSLNPFIGPPVQPPGLPATLVPLLVLTGGAREAAAYKLFMVACVLAFLASIATYFARHGTKPLAVATVLVTGLWIETGFATNVVQPDAGFCAFVWATFCLADAPGEWSWGRVVAITALGIAAFAYRVAALPLVPGLALYALLHRRQLGTRPWVPVLVWCLGGALAAAASPGVLTFARLVPRDPGVLIAAIVTAARVYPFAVLDLFLYPLPWNRANDVYHLVIALLAVVGAIVWVPRVRSRLSILFAVFYAGMLLVLPMQDGRYLMPIAPLAVFSAAVGIAVATSAVARLTRRHVAARGALGRALAVVVGIVVLTLGREVTAPGPSVLMDAPGVRAVFARLRAARDSGTVRAVFMNPRVLTWETGVPAMGFFRASADTTLAEFRAKGITHVVVGDLDTDPLRAPSVAAAVAARPDAFRRLHAEGAFTLYAFDSARSLP